MNTALLLLELIELQFSVSREGTSMDYSSEDIPITDLASRYQQSVEQSYCDLLEFSGLHLDFISDGLRAIEAKKHRSASPLLGELFPHLVAEGLRLGDGERRRLAAAWLALYGYISLIDFQLDHSGSLDARTAMSASALLGWGMATISGITSATPFADVFFENVRQAFAGQYADVRNRSDEYFDRRDSDIDKNRAIVAVIAAYCAANNEPNERLIRATELLLGPFQILDDLRDVREDLQENNITVFAKIVKDIVLGHTQHLTDREIYGALFSDSRTVDALLATELNLDRALLLLDERCDTPLITFLVQLRTQLQALTSTIREYQTNPTAIREENLVIRVSKIICAS
jgi:hypothetical protein